MNEAKKEEYTLGQTPRIKFAHINIIARDFQRLADFYNKVFDCEIVSPERNLSGDWLSKGTGVEYAKLRGVHLKLPCCNNNGPTLEIHQYENILDNYLAVVNRKGFGHIAFEVEDLISKVNEVVSYGGDKIGEVANTQIEGVGILNFICVTDPERNIIELQHWDKK